MAATERPLPPAAEWNEDEECWEIEVGDDITVRFIETEVYVIGSLVNMRVFYDQVTEERGIEFSPASMEDMELELVCQCGGKFMIHHGMVVCNKCDQLAQDVFGAKKKEDLE